MNQLEMCIIISVLTIISYAWGKINMGTTAMLSMAAFVLTGCIDGKEALANFANPNTVMMLSMFVVAAGFNRTKFVRMCASSVNNVAKGSLTKIMMGYIGIAALLCQFIQSGIVVFGIVAPMLIASCDELDISPSKVMFPLAIACIATLGILPLGGGATVFAELNGYLEANAYMSYTVGLMDPMKARLPMLIVSIIYCVFLAPKFAPNKPSVELSKMESKKEDRIELSIFKERSGYIIFILVTLGLICQRQLGLDAWLICFIGAIMMVVLGVLSEKEAIEAIPWWMGFLFVGSLTMGGALTATGAGEAIGGIIAKYVGGIENQYLIGFVFFIVPFILTQFMMNRSVMTIFIPISILACKSLGANPIGIIILVQSGCLSSFMTPMSTATVSMSMAAGGYNIKDVFKQSIIPAIILCVVNVVWIMSIFPMF